MLLSNEELTLLNQKKYLFQMAYSKLSDFERKDFDENFTVEYTHDSTAIEGNTLTLMETKLVLVDKLSPEKPKPLKDIVEIQHHVDAWNYVKELVAKKAPLSERVIKDIHQLVVQIPGIGGIYRDCPVYIRGSRHVPPDSRLVYNLMGNFAYQIEHRDFDSSIEKAGWLHAELVKIHPFQDGNGRTARLLMNNELMMDGYPPTSIKESNVGKYFKTLEHYELTDDMKPFISLLSENLNQTLDGFLRMYNQHFDMKKIEKDGLSSLKTLAESYIPDEVLQLQKQSGRN